MGLSSSYGGDILFKSRPVRVHWAGWESDTHRLQSRGWELAAYEDPVNNDMCLAFNKVLPQTRLQAITKVHRFDFQKARWDSDYLRDIVLEVQAIGRDVHVAMPALMRTMMGSPLEFHPIDARPEAYHASEVRPLDQLCHFRSREVSDTGVQLVVPEEDVESLLQRILDKQQPAKAAYYKEQDLEERASGLLVPKVQAKIITLSDRRKVA